MREQDVIIVGGGLAGLVAAYEITRTGRRVVVLEQENGANLGGQAFWSLGGLFLVDTPEQRRTGIHDSVDLALSDWFGSAGFDREEDHWPRQWARAYVEFAAGEKRSYLHDLGLRLLPNVGWAERGDGTASGHGNSVPRFHLTWGTGPEVVRVFREPVQQAERDGLVRFRFRHRVDELVVEGGAVVGVRGAVLADDPSPRGEASNRDVAGDFELRADAVVMASGGIGGDAEKVRRNWPVDRLGPAPTDMICGVPAYVDGRGIDIAVAAGANLANRDRMWHYTEGIVNHSPIWPNHGIRILPGPSSLWLDALGRRLPPPLFPGFDTLGTLAHIVGTGHHYSWFIANAAIVEKEFALSGSEQNPDFTGKDLRLLAQRVKSGPTGPVDAFLRRGADFVVRDTLPELVAGMNAISPGPALDPTEVELAVTDRDRQTANPFAKDMQITAIHNARAYKPDRIVRVAAPKPLTDPKCGPLVAVRLHLLTRKTLGGLETTLDGQVVDTDGTPIDGLYAAGEAAGFGGGGVHGYRALEGTFLGGCIFSGRAVGRALR